MRLGSIVLLGFLAACQGAPTRAAISAPDLEQRLFAIAHDSMGGRATGSRGGYLTADYIASEFARLGLEPAGEDGTFFQTIPFFRFRGDTMGGLTAGGNRLAVGRDLVPIAAPVPNRPVDGREVILGGPLADSTNWPAAAALKDRIVILVPPQELDRRIGGLLGVPRRSARMNEAAIIVIPILEKLGGETVASLIDGRVVTDTSRDGSGPLIVLATGPAADALLGAAVASAAPGTVGPAVGGEVGVGFFPLDFPARNVIGVLRGRDADLAQTYVSVTAHSDHVGFDRSPVDHDSIRAFNRVIRPMGADNPSREPNGAEAKEIQRILDSLRAVRPARPDSIRNGADDDGSGTVALLEVAEAFAKGERPRRSLLFVSHAAEEMGLLGSAWFTDHPTVPIDSIVSEMDMDMIGRGAKTDLPDAGPGYLEMIGTRRLSSEYGDIFDRVNARQPEPFQFNLTFDEPGHPLQYYCRADHYSYARYGIPSMAMSRGEHLDYHQVTDESQYIDYQALRRVARFAFDVASEVANLDHRPALDHPKGDPKAPCVQ